jgi:serine kinase of HPr protein (carbohydrate metabolism regulator)
MILHAGLIARHCRGSWRGVLIQGPSGAGKSDLALRALAEGFTLVADDRTLVFVSGDRLFGRAPTPLSGLIEVRGQGVLRQTTLPFAQIMLSVHCATERGAVERMPDVVTECFLGFETPRLDIWPFEHSAPAKIGRAIEHLGARR